MDNWKKYIELLEHGKDSTPKDVNDHIMVFDGLNTFIRSFSATPTTNEDGEHVGGLTGFLYSVGKAIRDYKPTRCIIVFDGVGGSKKRKAISPAYKANRANKTKLRRYDHTETSIEDEQKLMRQQFQRLIEYLDALPVTFISIDGIEADDTIAYIANKYHSISKKITIVSTDRDFYQLIDDHIQVWSPTKKKMYSREALIQEFSVSPENFVLYRTFTGDKSDNIEGLKGVGDKTLLKIFPELGSRRELSIDYILKKIEMNSDALLEEKKKIPSNYKTIAGGRAVLELNQKLMNLKELDFSSYKTAKIRSILDAPIPLLNKFAFQKMFMEDRMWSAMKNMPEWLSSTWMSLDAFARQTNK